jgi:hypothetical protein
MRLNKTRESPQAPTAAKSANGNYRAVSIVGASNACAAAKALADQRILLSKAPMLPLPDCTDAGNCRCRFEKHEDRREEDGARRLSDATAIGRWEQAAWYSGLEKRKRRGRREDD